MTCAAHACSENLGCELPKNRHGFLSLYDPPVLLWSSTKYLINACGQKAGKQRGRGCVFSCSVRTRGLWPVSLLCPWDFPGRKNTGVGCHFLLLGILSTQGSNPHLLCLLHGQADSLLLCCLGNKEGRRRKEKTKRKEEREAKGKPEMKPRETRRETSSIHLPATSGKSMPGLETLGSFATLPCLFFSSLEP